MGQIKIIKKYVLMFKLNKVQTCRIRVSNNTIDAGLLENISS